MNLDQAIQQIISENGAEILKERRLIGFLSDYQAFEQFPYAANMLRQIYANGCGQKMYELYINKDKTETTAFIFELRNKFGFDTNMVAKVLNAFSLHILNQNKPQRQDRSQRQEPPQRQNKPFWQNKQTKKVKTLYHYKGDYYKDLSFDTPYYILRENEAGIELMNNIHWSNYKAIIMGFTSIDLMPGLIFKEKYSSIKEYYNQKLIKELSRELSNSYVRDCFKRYVILLKIDTKELNYGTKAQELRNAIEQDDFIGFLKNNDAWLDLSCPWSNEICPNNPHRSRIVTYFYNFSMNLKKKFSVSDTSEVKELLLNIFKNGH